ncbi:MAG TPA: MBL fold metallo-hydrolase [Syntrophobacteraceae bacterium]|nr:MBL fold metallo-hydrolase [Syntrophobacteraceae bacterium]
MIVRCYGARGSIPVSGKEYFRYGGDTCCLEVRSRNDEIIIVDTGTGVRRLGKKLILEGRSEFNILFTHSHWDHILGFPFFKPIYSDKTILHLRGCPTAQGNIQRLLSKAMSTPLFPVPFDKLNARILYDGSCPSILTIDSIQIHPIHLSHPNVGLGFKFVEKDTQFVFLTDNELGYRHKNGRSFEEYVEFARGSDLLIHDAEFTPQEYAFTRTWGHSTYLDALDLAMAAGVKRLGLFHHNQDRKDEDMDRLVRHCREIADKKGTAPECFALTQDTELVLE